MKKNQKEIFDCVIIGGGVVGGAIFNKLVRLGKSCVLVDKASDVATGASKANSGLVHAGYDPAPGTLKAKLNVRGAKLFPKICRRLGVPLRHCGALVVGDDRQKVEALFQRGKQNGVNVEILDKSQLHAKVPNLAENLNVALWAKDAGIVSPYLFTICLVEEGIINGGKVLLDRDVLSVKKTGDIFEVDTQQESLFARKIVNSAGAGYNEIARIIGSEEKEIEFRRGQYFVFDKNSLPISCTIFPLPTVLGKGVLLTPTIDGNFLVGPTSEASDESTCEGLREIQNKARLIMPDIDFKNAIREFAGVRAICGDDFVIERSKKVDGVVNLAGICSPGLSSAPAIAEMVANLLDFDGKECENLKKLQPYVMFKNMSSSQQKECLQRDASFGQIVCKCEKITKGDVLGVLNRPLAIKSVDAVKRRTNAGMGRCQGGFCFTKVVSAIAKERGLKFEEVQKENRGSFVAVGDIREESKW